MIRSTKSAGGPNRWQSHLVEATHLLNVSYGYTISIWAAGAIAMSHFGPPTLENVFAFVLGAIAAYLLLVSIARPGRNRVASALSSAQVVTNWVPVLSAVLVSVVCAAIPSDIGGYLVASLSATLSYALALTLLSAIRERHPTGSQANRP